MNVNIYEHIFITQKMNIYSSHIPHVYETLKSIDHEQELLNDVKFVIFVSPDV